MNNHEQRREQFQPETVDERVEQLLRLHRQKSPVAPDEQLVQDLHTLYEANTGTRERVWQRLTERIASNDATTVPFSTDHEESRLKSIKPFERHHPMKQEVFTPQRVPVQRLGLMAAVLLAALVVGSMLWIFTLARDHNNGSGTASPGEVQQKPASYSGVYISNSSGLVRINFQTGKVIWRYKGPDTSGAKTNTTFISQFVPAGDTIYALVTFNDPNKPLIVALNAENGNVRWSQSLIGEYAFVNMIVEGNAVYVGTLDAFGNDHKCVVYSFAVKDGKKGKTYSVPARASFIAATKGTLYAAAENGLYSFDLASSQQRWYTALKVEDGQSTLTLARPSIVNGVLYTALVSSKSQAPQPFKSRVAAFSADSGKQLWQSNLIMGQITDLAVSNGVIYLGASGAPSWGALYAYDAQKGKQLWTQKYSAVAEEAPAVDNGVVYASTYADIKQPGSVVAVGAGNGKPLWQHQITDAKGITTSYVHNGIVYVCGMNANKSKLYALNAGDGSQVWTLDLESLDYPNMAVVA